MDKQVADVYGGRVRVRASGICWHQKRLLMVNHRGITSNNFWAPPGGGVEFGQAIADTLKREFAEETGLKIEVGKFMFGCEFIKNPIHSIELFYSVHAVSGNLAIGSDPEIQIIDDVRFFNVDEIATIPTEEIHGVFRFIESASQLERLTGFLRI